MMINCNRAQRWLGGSLMGMLVVGCGLMPSTNVTGQVDQVLGALGAVLDELPTSGGLTLLASDRGDMPPPGAGVDVAKMMEMIKAMAGSQAFDDDEDDEADRAESMAAMAAMQAGGDVAPQPSDTTVSAREAELMEGLGGIPVKSGRVTQEELRQRLLTQSEKE